MSRAVKHGSGWRIRWFHAGKRTSEVYAADNDAVSALARRRAEGDEMTRLVEAGIELGARIGADLDGQRPQQLGRAERRVSSWQSSGCCR